eukprot:TRINITY_DN16863_c0_g1_i1.p2 TRINITY_DN16863_c0_g1~~TRINITY_DN16863_c0_g1_i1.p2  ORF type:complete len:90 (+),score=19.64 TRINITY_DN16863_c0_g1_i1:331-600(+)
MSHQINFAEKLIRDSVDYYLAKQEEKRAEREHRIRLRKMEEQRIGTETNEMFSFRQEDMRHHADMRSKYFGESRKAYANGDKVLAKELF